MKKRILRPNRDIPLLCVESHAFRKNLFVALWNSFSKKDRKSFLELTRLEVNPIPVEVAKNG